MPTTWRPCTNNGLLIRPQFTSLGMPISGMRKFVPLLNCNRNVERGAPKGSGAITPDELRRASPGSFVPSGPSSTQETESLLAFRLGVQVSFLDKFSPIIHRSKASFVHTKCLDTKMPTWILSESKYESLILNSSLNAGALPKRICTETFPNFKKKDYRPSSRDLASTHLLISSVICAKLIAPTSA